MTLSIGRSSVIGRLLMAAIALVLVWVCGRGLVLVTMGQTVTATVTNVRFNRTRPDEDDRNIYETHAYIDYTFTVNDTAYTGSADLSVSNRDTYNATGVYRGDYDTAFVKQNENRTAIAVKYWPVWPKMNGAAEQNDADTIAIVWRVAGLVLALVMLVLAVKPRPKAKTLDPAAMAGAAGYVNAAPSGDPPTFMAPAVTAPAAEPTPAPAAAYCPACGAATAGGKFCPNCGKPLV